MTAPAGLVSNWDQHSTDNRRPPYLLDFEERMKKNCERVVEDIMGARPLLILGDYVTTDHISPAGAFSAKSVAVKYLLSLGVNESDFNTYGSRRGNHRVMIRGTFANPRIKNQIMGGSEGALTKHFPDGETLSIYDASMKYQKEGMPLVVIAGKGFGTGSSRDWAAKGQKLLGITAVIAESFERIHRSNLIGMGVLPLQFEDGFTAEGVGIEGTETYDITGLEQAVGRGSKANLTVTRKNGEQVSTKLTVRLDSQVEKEYYKSGGILDYVLRVTVERNTKDRA